MGKFAHQLLFNMLIYNELCKTGMLFAEGAAVVVWGVLHLVFQDGAVKEVAVADEVFVPE